MGDRLLALDLDGTLLGPDDQVGERDAAAVRAAVDAGWHVVLATARWHQLAERTAVSLGLATPVIACSGAEVRGHDGTDLLDVRIPADVASAVHEACDAGGGIGILMQGEDVVIGHDLPLLALPEVRKVERFSGAADLDPRCFLLAGPDLVERVRPLVDGWAGRARCLTSMSGNGFPMLTITGAGADKGLALAVACQELGVDPADAVAIGDSEADVEMFRAAGTGVAMGNADEVVQAAATWVTASNAEAGVAAAIDRLLA
jgi:hydroxymethylpyrimidine pyrophosphatase-like HAD family hydrolase